MLTETPQIAMTHETHRTPTDNHRQPTENPHTLTYSFAKSPQTITNSSQFFSKFTTEYLEQLYVGDWLLPRTKQLLESLGGGPLLCVGD